ncbi:MAG: hypothetical protein MJ231_02235 [bacterium]|nr:hypothetical protein [bacterium]
MTCFNVTIDEKSNFEIQPKQGLIKVDDKVLGFNVKFVFPKEWDIVYEVVVSEDWKRIIEDEYTKAIEQGYWDVKVDNKDNDITLWYNSLTSKEREDIEKLWYNELDTYEVITNFYDAIIEKFNEFVEKYNTYRDLIEEIYKIGIDDNAEYIGSIHQAITMGGGKFEPTNNHLSVFLSEINKNRDMNLKEEIASSIGDSKTEFLCKKSSIGAIMRFIIEFLQYDNFMNVTVKEI